MARTTDHHHKLTGGVGKCSVPMWIQGCPAGFCDEPAYGKPIPCRQFRDGWTGEMKRFDANITATYRALRAQHTVAPRSRKMGEIRIVFDGPPAHESGRFVEVENAEGQSIDAGEWRQREDGFWELRIVGVDLEAVANDAAEREAERKIAEEDAREEELANGQFGVGA